MSMFSRAFSGWGRLIGLGQSANSNEEEERRLWGRITCDVETTCQSASEADPPVLSGRLRNISRGGLNLRVSQSFEPGSLLSVALPVGEGTEILACVVRCEQVEVGLWELGCTFAAQLSDEDLQHFGARREKAVPPDQRTWVRFACAAGAAYRVVRTGRDSIAAVLNISASGIALRPEESLRVGELLNLELSRDGRPVLTTLASVVRTAKAPGGERIVGCNFIRELTEEQVQA